MKLRLNNVSRNLFTNYQPVANIQQITRGEKKESRSWSAISIFHIVSIEVHRMFTDASVVTSCKKRRVANHSCTTTREMDTSTVTDESNRIRKLGNEQVRSPFLALSFIDTFARRTSAN